MIKLLRREFTVELPLEKAWQHLTRLEEWPSWARHIRQLGLEHSLLPVSHECNFPPLVANKPRATFAYVDSQQASGKIDGEVKSRYPFGDL